PSRCQLLLIALIPPFYFYPFLIYHTKTSFFLLGLPINPLILVYTIKFSYMARKKDIHEFFRQAKAKGFKEYTKAINDTPIYKKLIPKVEKEYKRIFDLYVTDGCASS